MRLHGNKSSSPSFSPCLWLRHRTGISATQPSDGIAKNKRRKKKKGKKEESKNKKVK